MGSAAQVPEALAGAVLAGWGCVAATAGVVGEEEVEAGTVEEKLPNLGWGCLWLRGFVSRHLRDLGVKGFKYRVWGFKGTWVFRSTLGCRGSMTVVFRVQGKISR